jgi:uncharacterized protein (TIGR02466 family)
MENTNSLFQFFSIPIYSSTIPTNIFSQIKKDVINHIDNNYSNFKQHWNCPTLSDISSKKGGSINSQTLREFIIHTTNIYYNEWEFEPLSLEIEDLWVNISPPGSYQESHRHLSHYSRNIFSGVIYIDVEPNSGSLILENPLEISLFTMPSSNKYSANKEVIPISQDIIIFPSWINHYTTINKTNKNRISVSWNIEISKQNNNA